MSSNTNEILGAPVTGGSSGGERGPGVPRPGPRFPALAARLRQDRQDSASFRPVSSETDLARVAEAAASDGHHPICPTHFAEKQGQVIGYASIAIVPMVFCWSHSHLVQARESFALLAKVEEQAKVHAPAGVICTPCGFGSPFYKFMPKLGYLHCGDGGIFLKDLRI